MKFFTALLLIFAAILAVSAQDVFDVLSDSESMTESSLKAGDAACLKAGLNLRWAPCGNTVASKSKGGERYCNSFEIFCKQRISLFFVEAKCWIPKIFLAAA